MIISPMCPICGRILITPPEASFTRDQRIPPGMVILDTVFMLLLVRHVIKHHPDWIELAD